MHCKDTILRTQNNWPYSKLIPNSGNESSSGSNINNLYSLFSGINFFIISCFFCHNYSFNDFTKALPFSVNI